MRKLVVAAIGVALVVGVAFAQEQTPVATRPTVQFELAPEGHDFARNYPLAAMQQNLQGVATLCCAVRPDRTLACDVAYEWPAGHEFGQASLNVAQRFRVSADSYRALQATGDLSLRRTIRWVLPDVATEQQSLLPEAYNQARAATCSSNSMPSVG